MAENQAFEKEIVGATAGVLTTIYQPAYLVKGLPVDERLMGTLYHHPVFRLLADALLRLVVDFPAAPLNHVADIGLILQHVRDALTGP